MNDEERTEARGPRPEEPPPPRHETRYVATRGVAWRDAAGEEQNREAGDDITDAPDRILREFRDLEPPAVCTALQWQAQQEAEEEERKAAREAEKAEAAAEKERQRVATQQRREIERAQERAAHEQAQMEREAAVRAAREARQKDGG